MQVAAGATSVVGLYGSVFLKGGGYMSSGGEIEIKNGSQSNNNAAVPGYHNIRIGGSAYIEGDLWVAGDTNIGGETARFG
jgi:hypothetical protein